MIKNQKYPLGDPFGNLLVGHSGMLEFDLQDFLGFIHSISTFISTEENSITGLLCLNVHGKRSRVISKCHLRLHVISLFLSAVSGLLQIDSSIGSADVSLEDHNEYLDEEHYNHVD